MDKKWNSPLARNGLNIKVVVIMHYTLCIWKWTKTQPRLFLSIWIKSMAGMAILSPVSYVFVPTTRIKRQNKLPKFLSWGFIFFTTLYLSTCLGIYDVQITGNCICKSKKKKISPGFYHHPQTEGNYSVLSRQHFLKKSVPAGPF